MAAGATVTARAAIIALLLGLAAASWAALAWQGMGGMAMAGGSLTMAMGAPLFLGTWVVMMVAMMFPAAAPMILTFHKVQAARRRRGDGFVGTSVFVSGYLLVWVLSGVVAYTGALAAEAFAAWAALSGAVAARIGGAVLIVAGAYQLSPLKDSCLAKCRTPVGFIMTSWRDGPAGALRMGLLHGVYCLGCCWLLFAILFPLGMMNIGAMALITLVILAEKMLPGSRAILWATAVALVAYGAAVMFAPRLLTTFMASDSMAHQDMPARPMPAMPMPPAARR